MTLTAFFQSVACRHAASSDSRSLHHKRRPQAGKTLIPVVLLNLLLGAAQMAGAAEISPQTALGGYGELHFNATIPDTGLQKPGQFDFHRFVLFIGHRFNEQWSFASEIELEHNFVEGNIKSGYLTLEQAYLQWNPSGQFCLKGGILLQPQGLLNLNHEPNRFSTVERPEYHKIILPTTWYGAGIGAEGFGFNQRLNYIVTITEGLDDRKFGAKNQGIREARQKGAYSKLDNLMGTLRLDYLPLRGLTLGASSALNFVVLDNDTASTATGPNPNRHLYKNALITELHAAYNAKGIRSSIEFAHIGYSAIEGRGGALESTQGITAEAGYDIARLWGSEQLALLPFVRYSRLNPSGKLVDEAAFSRLDAGLALHPLHSLAIKIDYGREMFANAAVNRSYLNAGIGYAF